MRRLRQLLVSFSSTKLPVDVMAMAILLILVTGHLVSAQTYQVLHAFSGGANGAAPVSGLTMDAGGNFYGISAGGTHNFGMVYKLSNKNSGWVLTPLYSFQGAPDGSTPGARAIFGPDGALYGTTEEGGSGGDIGTVYRLSPPATFCGAVFCPWNERILYSFTGFPSDGIGPQAEVVFDSSGNLYGTTVGGGSDFGGIAYEITSAGVEIKIHDFGSDLDGAFPYAPLILDAAGNLYGAASEHPRFGLIFELLHSGPRWTERGLWNFYSEDVGSSPFGGLVFDPQGNLYGTASDGGPGSGGVIFQLAPGMFSYLYHDIYDPPPSDGGPNSTLILDAAGNLYGTAGSVVFKLSPSGGTWTYTVLHRFTGGSDGGGPHGPLVMDADGKLYGTTSAGGNLADCGGSGCGVVFEITP